MEIIEKIRIPTKRNNYKLVEKSMYQKFVKRFIDFSIALIAMILLFPFFVIIYIILAIVTKENPIFTQRRSGKDCRIFKIIKFKTMSNKTDAAGVLLPDKDRITKIGDILRKTSIDELPQLVNILKGDMSLIGPRPQLEEFLPLYSATQLRRHEVRPGITGWAQVNGRNKTTWTKRFKQDVWYVDNISMALDIIILYNTVKYILKSEGIDAGDGVTMEKFNGRN